MVDHGAQRHSQHLIGGGELLVLCSYKASKIIPWYFTPLLLGMWTGRRYVSCLVVLPEGPTFLD